MVMRAPGRQRLPPGPDSMWHCRLRRGLTVLAARCSPGPYLAYCALRPRAASGAPGTRISCRHLASFDRRGNGERLDGLPDVVHAEHPRPVLERGHRRAQRRREGALRARRVSEHARERTLAREPDHDRPAERGELVEPADELQVLVGRLPEPDPRVDADALLRDPALDGEPDPLLEEREHFGRHVVKRGIAEE